MSDDEFVGAVSDFSNGITGLVDELQKFVSTNEKKVIEGCKSKLESKDQALLASQQALAAKNDELRTFFN
jgi:hypothetical protein